MATIKHIDHLQRIYLQSVFAKVPNLNVLLKPPLIVDFPPINLNFCLNYTSHTSHLTLDRSLTYKSHCLQTKQKVFSRNNLLRRLTTTKSGVGATATCAFDNRHCLMFFSWRICVPSVAPIRIRKCLC